MATVARLRGRGLRWRGSPPPGRRPHPTGGRLSEPADLPIERYAAIGDCHGCALVGADGRIDWCALGRFDAPPVFLRLLDAGRGGSWWIRPADTHETQRSYLGDTNILQTRFSTATGAVALTDFMPVGRQLDAGAHDYVHLNAPNWLVRRVEGLRGTVTLRLDYRPTLDYARSQPRLDIDGHAVRGDGLPTLYGPVDFSADGGGATARFTLREGERRDFVLAANTVFGQDPIERVDEFFGITRAFWTEWIDYCRYRGPHAALVRRSALALKLMTFAPTGALVAALTTSLPEGLGGERNWDYRFCWLRDSGFALYALAALGYGGEARCFHDYLVRACRRTLPEVQIMYGVNFECVLEETQLDHLAGYAGSRPVRIGNGAYRQHQIDVYGEVLDLALLYRSLGGSLGAQYERLLATFADFVAAHWDQPDQGLWEMRGPPRHHVHGKLMSWVALDRAARLLPGGARWANIAERVRASILAEGIDAESGHLKQAYDGGVDAAVMLAPMLGFELDDRVIERTLARVHADLGRGDFLLRYHGEDGLAGDEGAFLACSFWYVDALLALGRAGEARALFDRLAARANDVGLFAEEIEPTSGAFLGNFPQAFTHLALVTSAVNLDLVQRHGVAAARGCHADRVRRSVEATFGWRGIWAAVKSRGRIGRLGVSRASMLAWP